MAADDGLPVPPYQARYEVYASGFAVGEAVITLTATGPGAYQMTSEVHPNGLVALLASGQNSTLTGTLAGQIVMEGFLNIRLKPQVRRLITRGLAIIPAVIVIGWYGESKTTDLLVASQVVLSMQLGFAVWPLLRFTGEKAKMGVFVNPLWVKVTGYAMAFLIIGLNVKFLSDMAFSG